MSGGYFSYALLAGLATALLVAAYTDIRRREIDNTLNAAVALAAPIWWMAAGLGWEAIAIQLGLTLVTFVIACGLFVAGQMGGGDVKLLTALALWFVPPNFLQLVVMMAILGGAGSVAMAAFNMRRVPGEGLRNTLAALAATGWVGCAAAIVFAVVTKRPLFDEAALQTLQENLPPFWLSAVIGLLVLGACAVGFIQIVRRQKSRLPIPYGVAIAAAGLWVLGDNTLQTIQIAG